MNYRGTCGHTRARSGSCARSVENGLCEVTTSANTSKRTRTRKSNWDSATGVTARETSMTVQSIMTLQATTCKSLYRPYLLTWILKKLTVLTSEKDTFSFIMYQSDGRRMHCLYKPGHLVIASIMPGIRQQYAISFSPRLDIDKYLYYKLSVAKGIVYEVDYSLDREFMFSVVYA